MSRSYERINFTKTIRHDEGMRQADATFSHEVDKYVRNTPELKKLSMVDPFFYTSIQEILNADRDLPMSQVVIQIIKALCKTISDQNEKLSEYIENTGARPKWLP
jgi:hypothetical protein